MKFHELLWVIRMGIGFAMLWCGMWAYTNYSVQKVEGSEMMPEFKGDTFFNLTDPTVRQTENLQRGDVVSYSYEGVGKNRDIAARVIGLPGDRVEIVNGQVIVNGKSQGGGSVSKKQITTDSYPEVIVPRGTVFLLCDARRLGEKMDSRYIGPVGFWALNGKFR